ncbi:MAG: tyrosine-type recombinase/integrase [Candidatus Sulfotelmatobacter sp.]
MERWLFRWRERCSDGTLRERNKVIGTVEEYPIKSKKLHEAVTRLRVNINTDGPTELTSITMAKAVDHYTVHELADCGAEGKAYSTRSRKTQLLNRWVVPHWGKLELRAIKTVAVEQWLKTLVTAKFGKPKPLAGGTREKIRDAMSSIFNHAIRWELTDRNPITGPTKRSGVRVSAKRERTPDILEIQEMQLLLAALGIRERAMLFLDMPSGLRRGELAGLKWEDFDFKKLHVSVTRSLVDQHVGPVKTETSRKLMPIDEFVARELLAWHAVTPYKKPSDYVWATDANRAGAKRGKQPVWLSTVMRDYIQPMARKLGIQKKMSWHTFRHTFSSILKGNGEDVKVVQELLRHSTSRMTLDTYTQALGPDKRAAQSKVVGMIRPKERVFSVYRDADGVSV